MKIPKIVRIILDLFSRKVDEHADAEEMAEITIRMPKRALDAIEKISERTDGGTGEVFRQAVLLYRLTREHLEEDPINDILFKTSDGIDSFPEGLTTSWKSKFRVIQGGLS